MKKLLLVVALFAAICYVGRAKAFTREEWEACANAEGEAAMTRLNNKEAIMKEICAFYKKPIDDCKATFEASSPEQKNQILVDFVVHGVLIPKCGNPNEAQ